MPFMTPDVTDERDALATFTRQQIHQFATTLQGLSPEQLAATPSASAMSLGALARHGILVAGDILARIRCAPDSPTEADLPSRTQEQAIAEGGIQPDALRASDTAEQLIGELEQVAEALDRAVREADLDQEVPIPEAPWTRGSSSWNVRFNALHAIEEFARHTGHADLLRESIDGAGAYELNARADGEEWPPAWLAAAQAGAEPESAERTA